MLGSRFVVAGVAATAMALTAVACGSSTATTGGTGGSSNMNGGPGIMAPGPMTGAPAGDGPGYVLAVSKLYLGDTNRDGTSNPSDGWKAIGFDIDGTISTAQSTNLCQPAAGGLKSVVYPDGTDGIDNSFGHLIFDNIIHGISSTAGSKINADIQAGKFTVILDIQKLGAKSAYSGLVTELYAGGILGHAAKFDGTDQWPVLQELLVSPTDITKSKVSFPQSYLVNNTWVSGTKADITLNLSVSGFSLALTIGSAQIAMEIDPSRKTAKNGTIAGVLKTSDLVAQIKEVAGSFDMGLCSGPTINGILNNITAASDIMSDGTQNPASTCDGISIGLGFDAALIAPLTMIAPPVMAKPNPCAGH